MLGDEPGPWEDQQFVYGPATMLLLQGWSLLWGVDGASGVSATPEAFAVRHLGVGLIAMVGVAAAASLTRLLLRSWSLGPGDRRDPAGPSRSGPGTRCSTSRTSRSPPATRSPRWAWPCWSSASTIARPALALVGGVATADRRDRARRRDPARHLARPRSRPLLRRPASPATGGPASSPSAVALVLAYVALLGVYPSVFSTPVTPSTDRCPGVVALQRRQGGVVVAPDVPARRGPHRCYLAARRSWRPVLAVRGSGGAGCRSTRAARRDRARACSRLRPADDRDRPRLEHLHGLRQMLFSDAGDSRSW